VSCSIRPWVKGLILHKLCSFPINEYDSRIKCTLRMSDFVEEIAADNKQNYLRG